MKTLVVYDKNVASSRCVVGLAVCAVVDGCSTYLRRVKGLFLSTFWWAGVRCLDLCRVDFLLMRCGGAVGRGGGGVGLVSIRERLEG